MIDDLVHKCSMFMTIGGTNLLVVDSSTGERMRFQTYQIPPLLEEQLDAELDELREEYGALLDHQVIRFQDEFGFCYLVHILEGYARNNFLIALGPYVEDLVSPEDVRIYGFRSGLSAEMVKAIEAILERVPVYDGEKVRAMYQILTTLLRAELRDIELIEESRRGVNLDPQTVFEKFQSYDAVERNYEFEARVLHAIETGDVATVERLMTAVRGGIPIPTRQRYDPLRNGKNLGITFNSIAARAALRGGLDAHLVHSLSTKYAVAIEECTNSGAVTALLLEAAHEYATDVLEYSLAPYTPLVREAILRIRKSLATPVALEELAESLNVAKEHLSRVFRRETGRTVTEYIHRTKIRESLPLIGKRALSIEAVAEMFAFCNAGYYGSVFKKVMGQTVSEYRATLRHR